MTSPSSLSITPALLETLLEQVRECALEAGKRIMTIYRAPSSLSASLKADRTPVTEADLAAHGYLISMLPTYLDVPIISEEGDLPDYAIRRTWPSYWLIDPLDGTKEFLQRNDEFTVNIALIVEGRPVLGVVYAPALQCLYQGISLKHYRLSEQYDLSSTPARQQTLSVRDLRAALSQGGLINLVCSRHHGVDALINLVDQLKQTLVGVDVECIPMGSSLKLCKVAAGEADCYPRLGPTSEWDTAAAQAIVEAAGGVVINPQFQALSYNQKASLLNPSFCVVANAPAQSAEDENLQKWFQALRHYYESID